MDIKDLLNKQEPLDPELAIWLDDGPLGGKCLRHPLVYSMFYTEIENAVFNAQLKSKKEYIAQCKAEGKWSSVVWMYERPYRFAAFQEIQKNLTDEQYWTLLGSIWTDAENIWQYKRRLKRLFHPKGRDWSKRLCMMDESEQQALAALPDTLVVYRGCSVKNKRGYSWTLDKSRARWFAKRFERPGFRAIVLTAQISKTNVLAYFAGRLEQEVVVLPEHLTVTNTERV